MERAQFVLSLSYDAVARFGHLVPHLREVAEWLGDDDPRLIRYLLQAHTIWVQFPQRPHVAGVLERARIALARVPERPDVVPVGRPYGHLVRVLGAMTMPHLLHKADRPSDGSCRILLQAEFVEIPRSKRL